VVAVSALRNPRVGPDAMFSEELPPSRGQQQTIATLAAQLLNEEPPSNRLEATILIARLRNALDRKAGVR
jgi:hypothetical protein